MTDAPSTASFAEFAKMLGVRPSYVSELKGAGRLVLSDDGRRVLVDPSRRRIEETRDPAKLATVERHAAARATESDPAGDSEAGAGGTEVKVPETGAYQEARARREHYQALTAQLDYERSLGKVLERATVEDAVGTVVTALRSRLELLPDILAPQVVGLDEPRVRTLLAEEIEHALTELSRALNGLAKAREAA